MANRVVVVSMQATNMDTALICRNVTVSGRRTSIRMEQVMWTSLTDICRREERSINEIISMIDEKRADTDLTAAIRVFLICYFRDASAFQNMRFSGMAEESDFDVNADPAPDEELRCGALVNAALDVVGARRAAASDGN